MYFHTVIVIQSDVYTLPWEIIAMDGVNRNVFAGDKESFS